MGPYCPNPFNPRTAIDFTLQRAGVVHLSVVDVRGCVVADLLRGEVLSPGRHTVIWDGLADDGSQQGSGVYFFHLESD